MKEFLFETKELLLSQLTIAVLAIIQIRIVAKSLGPESYGVIGVYLGIIGLCFRFLSSRNSDLLLINYRSYDGNFLRSSIIFELCLGVFSVLFSLTLLMITANYELLDIKSIPNYLLLFTCSRVFLNLLEVFKGTFTHIGDMKTYSVVESSVSILRFALVVFFILQNPTIENFFIALSLHSFLTGLIVLFILIFKNQNKDKKVSFKEYIKISKNNFFKIRTDQAVGLIPTQLDVVIIGLLTDFYSAGIYRVARKLVEPVNYIVVAFSPWMLNKINKDDKYNFRKLTFNILFPISIGIILIYTTCGEGMLTLIAGIDYITSYTPMLLLLMGYIFYLLTFWTRHYLFINDLILQHTIGRILYLVIFVALSYLLIDSLTFNGIAISISVGMIIQKLYEIYVYFKTKTSR
jgi:O-antigen/teichoic acid export membrane protein